MHTIVIGAGASGIVAGIIAAEKGERVTILEKNRKPLKKLGVTGNGRGNVLNAGKPCFYGDEHFAHQVLLHQPYETVKAFLERMGILLWQDEEKRVYPSAQQASVVVDALLIRAKRLGIDIILNTQVDCMKSQENHFTLTCTEHHYEKSQTKANGKVKKGALVDSETIVYTADRVIVAVGGAAAPMHGTEGKSYGLLENFGHALTPLKPALSALLTDPKSIEGLEGMRVRGVFTLCDARGKVLHQSTGEALFAKDGVSGIAPMQLSRFVEEGCTLHMNLTHMLTGQNDAVSFLITRAQAFAERPLSELMVGVCMPALWRALVRKAGVRLDEQAKKPQLEALGHTMADFSFSVIGVRGFEQAQVTAGGIETTAFDVSTMESRYQKGLYAVGEVLNVDGDCGGFNLLFAFASGMLAGDHPS